MQNNTYTIHFIRHAQSVVNCTPNIIGQSATDPLSELGVIQAKALSEKFKSENIDYIYSSTYERAFMTAKLAFPNRGILQTHDLREYSAGDMIGASRSEIITPEITQKMNSDSMGFHFNNGESLHQVQRRASEWLENNIIYNPSYENKNLTLAIFSHGMTIKCLLHYIMGFDQNFTWKIRLDNTSVSTVSYSNKGWFLHGINR